MVLRPILLLALRLRTFIDLNIPGNPPMDLRTPPLKIKIMLESKPLKSIMLV